MPQGFFLFRTVEKDKPLKRDLGKRQPIKE